MEIQFRINHKLFNDHKLGLEYKVRVDFGFPNLRPF